MGRFKIIIVAVKVQYYIVFQFCACKLSLQCACTLLYIVVICGLSVCNVYISTLCHKRRDFRKNITEWDNVYGFSLPIFLKQLFFEK